MLEGRLMPPCVIHRVGDYLYGAGSLPNDREKLKQLQAELNQIVLPFHQDILGPAGIYVERGWAHEAMASVTNGQAEFSVAGTRFHVSGFPSPPPPGRRPGGAVLLGGGMQFSPVGAEIVCLIRTAPNPGFIRIVGEILALYQLTLNSP